MCGVVIIFWPNGDNAGGVYHRMAAKVVLFYVIEVDRFSNAGCLIDIS